MPIRIAEAQAVRRIIEERFGKDHAGDKHWVICGDLNDYRQRVVIGGDAHAGYSFEVIDEAQSCLNVLLAGGFCENIVERRPELDRWTLYHTRGPQERHLCQLDYILVSPALAREERQARPRHHPRRPALAHDVSAGPGGRALSARRLGPAEGVGPLSGRCNPRHRLTERAVAFDFPRNVILPVDQVDVRLAPGPHPFETAQCRCDR